ncbi:MAG: hypothetical protein J6B64_03070 [Bacilli bacterium]|nr:hypothetical protein [Bacilli bacterium]MBO5376363.1 hypothetical protein [Bacilli bacterium]MBP3597614.1 hypothetical protein [Clostridia bacterium]
MKDELYEFLKSDDTNKIFKFKENYRAMILKIPYDDRIDILCESVSYSTQDTLPGINIKYEYAGFYDKEKDEIFDKSYLIRHCILEKDYDYNEDYLLSSAYLKKELENDVNNAIRQHISDSPELFEDFTYESNLTEKDVYVDFVEGKTSENYEDTYITYECFSANEILEYITNKNDYIDEVSRDFIVQKLEKINMGLVDSKRKRELLKQIENDEGHKIHKIKSIVNSVDLEKMKTVTLTIFKDGIEQEFKYPTFSLRYTEYYNDLYTYDIISPKDRKIFKENYGNNADLNYEDIVKITYGKNILYEDKNYNKEVGMEL